MLLKSTKRITRKKTKTKLTQIFHHKIIKEHKQT